MLAQGQTLVGFLPAVKVLQSSCQTDICREGTGHAREYKPLCWCKSLVSAALSASIQGTRSAAERFRAAWGGAFMTLTCMLGR